MESEQITIVLFLGPASSSLTDSRSCVCGKPLLLWWAERMASIRNSVVHIIAHTQSNAEALRCLCWPVARVFVTTFSCADAALWDFTSHYGLDFVVMSTFATALLPPIVTESLVTSFKNKTCDITAAQDLPAGTTPWVISSAFLGFLRRSGDFSTPSHPGLAFRQLAGVRSEVSEGDNVYRRYLHPFLPEFGIDPIDTPYDISFDSPEDIDTANDILRTNTSPCGLELLRDWKRRQLDKDANHRIQFVTRRFQRSKPRVLYFAEACAFSGAENSLYSLISALSSAQFDLYAVLGSAGLLHDKLVEAGVNCSIIPSGWTHRNSRIQTVITRLIASIEPDLVHGNALEGQTVLATCLARGIPYVQHMRNVNVLPYRDYIEAASAVIAVSDYVRQKALRFSVDPDRIHVVRDEVDVSLFRPGVLDRSTIREKYRIPLDAKVILVIARYEPNKRHDLVLESFRRITNRLPNTWLVLVGETYWESRYYDLTLTQIESSGLNANVIRVPFMTDIREAHIVADVLVLPSEREGLGRCVVEAMAIGLPVVVTNSSGTCELVTNNVNGLVAPYGDSNALSDAIHTILTNTDLARQLAAAARLLAIKKFSSLDSSKRIGRIYSKLIADTTHA